MDIFLLILKIIGITLLVIIGLIIVLVLLILFLPIRYNITVSNQPDNDKLYARVKANWLLHFVNFILSYYEELYYRLRITLYTLISNKKKEKGDKRKKRRKNKASAIDDEPDEFDDKVLQEDDAGISTDSSVNTSDVTDNDDGLEIIEIDEMPDRVAISDIPEFPDDDTDTEEAVNEPGSHNKEEPKSQNNEAEEDDNDANLLEKAKEFLTKFIEFIFNIREKTEGIINKIKDIRDNIDYYIAAVNDKRNKEAFDLCINELVRILKDIRPRKIKGNVLLGREDPYDYGRMSTILGIAYPFISDKIKLETKSDEEITSYYIYIKGHITLFVLGLALAKIYFSKDVRRMRRIFKHEER